MTLVDGSLGIRKLDTGLCKGEDRIFLRSLVLTKKRSVTDGRICCSIYSACGAL